MVALEPPWKGNETGNIPDHLTLLGAVRNSPNSKSYIKDYIALHNAQANA